MRPIDADALIKFIESGLNSKDPNKQFGNDAVQIMAEIEFAPTIAPRPDWTPCAEGLPKENKIYRVIAAYYQRGIVKDVIDNLWYYGNGEWQKYDDACKVIAWQPLPEPYNPDHIVGTNKKVED